MRTEITRTPFGTLPGGAQASQFTLANGRGMVVDILDVGGIIRAIHVPDRHGRFADVALGFDTLEPYLQRGCEQAPWDAAIEDGNLVLYRGSSDTAVVYSLGEDNEIVVRRRAASGRPMPASPIRHSCFNLRGSGLEEGGVLGHEIVIDADRFVPIDAGSMPLRSLVAVTGTPFDFRQPRAIGERIGQPDKQLRHGGGYDHCWVLNRGAGQREPQRAVRVYEPDSGRVLELYTQAPGVRFCSGKRPDDSSTRQGGGGHPFRSGFRIEPHYLQNAPGQPDDPDTPSRPGEMDATALRMRFSVED